jgi:integrative and conjugative element protein (TIGR02256 family)
MRILLTAPIAHRLQRELRLAGRREIGGLLMGEHVGLDVFRVVEISVQHSGGSRACFVRYPHEHQAELDRFFERCGGDYTRFNYLGEWHSHPSFTPVPSGTDLATMQSIVSDATVGVHFLVLMIVKLSGRRELQLSATAFRPGVEPLSIDVDFEGSVGSTEIDSGGFLAWVRRLFSR